MYVAQGLDAMGSKKIDPLLQRKMDDLIPFINKNRDQTICITMDIESDNKDLHTVGLALDSNNNKIIYIDPKNKNGSIFTEKRKIKELNITPFKLARHIQKKIINDYSMILINLSAIEGSYEMDENMVFMQL